MVWKSSWDPAKAAANHRKHGIRFEEEEMVFLDPYVIVFADDLHSVEEDRFIAIGETSFHRTLFVSFTILNDQPWLISARRATRAETRRYMRGDRIHDRGTESDDDINFDDIPEVTDFSKGVRGRFYMRPSSLHRVSIAGDLVRYFPDEAPINTALRELIKEGRTPDNIPPRPFEPEWIMRVSIADDVARHFNDDESVNAALRMLIDDGRAPKPKE
ncbi:MAG TPA: BrnT family toxin [Thermoanaerobaculia bacterium]|nr:BrnT family toxin [Thermoanaerobaculia bacterium]